MSIDIHMCVWVDAIFIRGIMFLCFCSTATAVMFLYLPSTAATVGSASSSLIRRFTF